jgi:hypothetical protein
VFERMKFEKRNGRSYAEEREDMQLEYKIQNMDSKRCELEMQQLRDVKYCGIKIK